jgi:L-iditol 2-dehydrogenase
MDWIVPRGVEKIPDGVSFDRASLVEPINTCHKAAELAAPQPGEMAVILGQGPIGLIFTMLARRSGARLATTDMIPKRRELALKFGAEFAWDPRKTDVVGEVKRMTAGRGADLAIVAASSQAVVDQAMACSRPGSRILLFAQTSDKERVEVSGAAICKDERTLFGCYSASVDLQAESARLVFSGELPVEDLISHRVALDEIERGFHMALHPDGQSLKIVVQPQRWSQ